MKPPAGEIITLLRAVFCFYKRSALYPGAFFTVSIILPLAERAMTFAGVELSPLTSYAAVGLLIVS